MRPKFKAWDINRKIMVHNPVFLYDRTGIRFTMKQESEYLYETETYADSFEWLQYTGMYDKNNVEICEGDVVRKLCGNYKVGQVTFTLGMFCFSSIGYGIYTGSDAFTSVHTLHYEEYGKINNYEIIGNIYESPELLEYT